MLKNLSLIGLNAGFALVFEVRSEMGERIFKPDEVGIRVARPWRVGHGHIHLAGTIRMRGHLAAKFRGIANEFRVAVVWAPLTRLPGEPSWTEKSLS